MFDEYTCRACELGSWPNDDLTGRSLRLSLEIIIFKCNLMKVAALPSIFFNTEAQRERRQKEKKLQNECSGYDATESSPCFDSCLPPLNNPELNTCTLHCTSPIDCRL